jgi:serine/threonine-protein kinase
MNQGGITGKTTTREARMTVGAYQVEGVLGEGGSAIVFEAKDAAGRAIALKVLRPDLALSPKEQQRFVDEADRLRRLQHPSIVQVLDSGVLPDGRPFIAMPRLQGRSLLERLQQGPVRFDLALALFEQLADALNALHRAGLVHRDIKPENIFVVEGDSRALLLDLGIARDMAADPTTTTRAGLIRGTPAYMAPERFFGKPATPATDIYELAVVFYVVLVGTLPWNAVDDPTARLRPIPPAQRGVVLPPRLADTLMRALSGQAQDRPGSTEAFSAALIEAVSPNSAQLIGASHTTSVRPATQPITAMPSGAFAPMPPAAGERPRVVAPTVMAHQVPGPGPGPIPVYAAAPQPPMPFVAGPPVWQQPMPVTTGIAVSSASPSTRSSGGFPLTGLLLFGGGVLAAGCMLVFAFVILPLMRGAPASGGGATAPTLDAPPVSLGGKSSADLPCCRALNEAVCPAPPAPCSTRPIDVDKMLRETPRFVLPQIDKNCCTSLESIKKAVH